MPLYLLDTNACSRSLGSGHPALAARLYERRNECVLSAVVWFELEFGRHRSPDPARTAARLTLLRTFFVDVLPFDDAAAERAAWVRAHLSAIRPDPQPIGHYDTLIAGHALSLGAVLVTNNVAEFARVPGLVVEDWQKE
jgi:tRNA(fMet)-specific endonuclease VapC